MFTLCVSLVSSLTAQNIEDDRYGGLTADSGMTESERFARLLEVDWQVGLEQNPEIATYVGVPGHNDHWSDISAAGRAQAERRARTRLAVVESIDPSEFGEEEQVNYILFRDLAREEVEMLAFPEYLMPLTQLNGVQQNAAGLLRMMPNRSVAQLQDQLGRLRGLPRVIDDTIVLLREGLAEGVTPPAITLRAVPDQVSNMIVDTPEENPLLQGFYNVPASVPFEDLEMMRGEAIEVYTAEIAPAFARLETFLREEYLPAARTDIAATDLPDGEAWYAASVKSRTTLDLTPDEIHQIGLNEVARIRAEMERVKGEAGFEGSLEAFFEFLRTDPQFFHTEPKALLAEYRDIAKRVDYEMPKLFGLLPRLPYGVVEIPAYSAPSQTTAYYMPGSLESGRAGAYYANTYKLETRPRWEMEALSLHEAVPGHHHQIALQQEIENLPAFRRFSWGYTGFVEGWGLYAESLGEEMGFYQDPYSKFGQLTYEMWRAVRLVVDTGMHSKGWSRQQAIDYFKANAAKTENDIIVEIDRYIVWPGQALAYKLGELTIKRLRAQATEALGADFDVRAFHDEVLRHGALPLKTLEANIARWIVEQKQVLKK
ncbi:DUF885 domain-containing protein [Actomonas aquatica]|uniref:DUF885 domain-containing protein n=1 Tax=Actomonas aquatica TaxID=2866162 RepID=A0ABZ1CD66_9BACT|nr:DUF885 domain-containing protein [Opitutus sp. WL0086]WRQ89357.1 DUF885 domain-containing protein [Opitutus sp. WL0086]